jgi:hypothetical protein
MYRLTVDDKENYILVMRNILSSRLKIHFKYDVKVININQLLLLLLLLFRVQLLIEVQQIKKN